MVVNSRPFTDIFDSWREKKPRALETHLLPPTAPAMMRDVSGQDVLVMSRDDQLAIPRLQLSHPPLQLLNHASQERHGAVVPLGLTTEDGVLQVEQRKDVQQGCCHGASY